MQTVPGAPKSGFIIFADIEGYSRRDHHQVDIAALTTNLCDAALAAARNVGWASPVWQCTGDGFIAAPPSNASSGSILDFVRRTHAEFNPTTYGADPSLRDIRVRWGLDFGPYSEVTTFDTRNVVGQAPIRACRVGSFGDGGHVLLSEDAVGELGKQLPSAELRPLGVVTFKHGFSLKVHQWLGLLAGARSEPSKKGRRQRVIDQVRPCLRTLALAFVRALLDGGHVRRDHTAEDPVASAVSDLSLRASLLLPTDDGRHLWVPDDTMVVDSVLVSRFRYTFGDHGAIETGPGQTLYCPVTPRGVPGCAFKLGLVQWMVDLPKTEAEYVRVVTDPNGPYGRFNLTRDDVAKWTRRSQNFVSVPVPVRKHQEDSKHGKEGGGRIAVVSFDWNGRSLKLGKHDEHLRRTLDQYSKHAASTEFGLMEILVSQLMGG